MTPHEEAWLSQAVALATSNVADGGGPFGALVVRAGVVIGTGQNRVTRDNDPTAHAEVLAIRAACQAIGSFSLAGCTLYTSCEPCPLCLAACLWARVDRVLFAADREDAARAGFDDSVFWDQFGASPGTRAMPVVGHRVPSASDPMDAWLARPTRIEY
ncbi:nucleoside deaminase [Cellulomonas fengjieae]|uniref:Nucleoside deaminase n=1 Tax=Cellulomonas fengjieae TaxID=2819978 RepID=A0ABS3SFY7_9CELL|nr:nucleoside deaminase [Cellulomonas fengjieae]MBO3084672.1 nucleoside deaminase [Cellulomonas fengjieae]MBO3103444.1 nucleoside deaminase [Cellulomonas fengjieae]QVI67004.1 nucleoside deaminase [Cellulomonas fengjieae]